MSELVKYHNDLNTAVMHRWTSEEMNFFIAIVAKIRENGTQNLVFDADELQEFTQYSKKHKKRWEETMKSAVKKISQLIYWEETEKSFRVIPMFNELAVDLDKRIVTIEVSNKYEYIFNKLDKYFTIFNVDDFLQIRSTYAKTMFRLLKQWRTVGKKEFRKDELFILLDVPKSTQTTANFTHRVLGPIKDELSLIFENLTITPIKAMTRGNPVIAYEFSWQPEMPKKKTEKIDVPKENNVKSTKKTALEPDEMIRISKHLMGFDD